MFDCLSAGKARYIPWEYDTVLCSTTHFSREMHGKKMGMSGIIAKTKRDEEELFDEDMELEAHANQQH